MARGETYEQFVEKFKPKKTTDDCYTPPKVYETVLDYCVDRFGIDRSKVVRPFWPGGDYQSFEYEPDSVVVDNPPFSILSKIVDWYLEHGIKFFLFAPALILMSAVKNKDVCVYPQNEKIVYENGAGVNTSFLTNLDNSRIVIDPKLREMLRDGRVDNPRKKITVPQNVIRVAEIQYTATRATELIEIPRNKTAYISTMDDQNCKLFGGGYLVSDDVANKFQRNKYAEDADVLRLKLSDKERCIVAELNKQ